MTGVGGAFLRAAARPALLALVAVTGLGTLLLASQALAVAPVVPGPAGAARVLLGVLPVAVGAGLPVAGLAGAVAAARGWRDGGEWLALAVSGHGARRVLGAVAAAAVALCLGQAALTHALEPAGRRLVRGALEQASGELSLRAGEPVTVADALVRARAVQGRRWEGVFIARDDLVVTAAAGTVDAGVVILRDGSARSLAGEGWTLTFDEARVPLRAERRRVEHAERTDADLAALVARMAAEGRDAAYESLILLKRTSQPLTLPGLLLLGVVLGARGARPAPAAVGLWLAWWGSIRAGDQAVRLVGPEVAAAAPVMLSLVAAAVAWRRWRDR